MNHSSVNSQSTFARIAGLGLLVAFSIVALNGTPLHAQPTYTWGFDAGGNWNSSSGTTGWNAGGAYPNLIGDTANLTFDLTAGRAVTINVTDATVGTLNLNDTGGAGDVAWTIDTSDAVNNKLTFDVTSGNATLTSAGGSNIVSAPVVLNNNLDITATNSLTLSGELSGSGGISKTGAGTVTLSSVNTFAGPLTVNGGTLSITAAGGYSGTSPADVRAGTLSITSATALSGTTSILVGDITGSSDATFSYGAGSDFANTNTITIQSGNTGIATLRVVSSGTRRNNANVILGSAGIGHGVTLTNSASGGGHRGIFSDPLGLTGPAGLVTISGTGITGFGNAGNSYSGGTVITGGNIDLPGGVGTYFGTGSLTIDGGGFQFSGGAATVNGLSSLILNASLTTAGSATTIIFNTPVNLGATGTAVTRTVNLASTGVANSVTLNGVISNGLNGFTNGITKNGARTLILGGANDYTGETIVNTGTLRITTGDDRLPTGTILSVNGGASSGGTFDLNNRNQTVAGLSGGSGTAKGIVTNTAVGSGTSTLTVTGTSTFDGTIQDGATAKVALIKSTGGTLTLTGTNTYTGSTTVSAGRLRISGTGSLTSNVTVDNGGSFIYDNNSTPFTGTLSLIDGKVGGSGALNVSVPLDALSDVLSPGNSPGILSFGSSQSWDSFTYEWETNNFPGTSVGTDFDQIQIAGGLTLNVAGNYELDILSLMAGNTPGFVPNFSETTMSWSILTTTTGISNFSANLWTLDHTGFSSSPSFSGTFTLSATANDLVLTYTAIPEPSTFALLGGVVLIMVLRRRRSAGGGRVEACNLWAQNYGRSCGQKVH